MRKINYDNIVEAVSKMCIEASCILPEDTMKLFKAYVETEKSPSGKSILEKCIQNAEIAAKGMRPICQDTGIAVFFIEMGLDLKIINGRSSLLEDAVNDGVRKGYSEGYLRKSVLSDPLFDRANTGDNTPAVIHLKLVEGDSLKITLAPKGGGAENMSRIKMLPPSAGKKGVVDFAVETVVGAGGNPCPPTVIGIGIGGTFEKCAYLAKKALMRNAGELNADERYAELEKEILKKINCSGVGPQGLGGSTTSFAVHVEYAPCHLASLPVAVNVNCHAHRHLTKEI